VGTAVVAGGEVVAGAAVVVVAVGCSGVRASPPGAFSPTSHGTKRFSGTMVCPERVAGPLALRGPGEWSAQTG
jgi:hypothetical protein